MDDYDRVVAANKARQPDKCNGCSREDTNGSLPCMPKDCVCCACDLHGKSEVEHYL